MGQNLKPDRLPVFECIELQADRQTDKQLASLNPEMSAGQKGVNNIMAKIL